MGTNDVNRAAKLPDYWTVNREDLGTRLTCFGSEYKTAEYFTRFMSEELGELLTKNIAGRQEDNSTDCICYLGNICRTEQPFIKDELKIDGG